MNTIKIRSPIDRLCQPARVAVLFVSLGLPVTGCDSSTPQPPPTGAARAGDDAMASPVFVDRAVETGLNFQHFGGTTGHYYFPEIMSSGAALVDYDGDGDLDVLLLQGDVLDGGEVPDRNASGARWKPGHRLFRNDLVPGGRLRFDDVTAAAGVGYRGYGMGIATGDIDNDGDPDLYVTHLGGNLLWRNDGNGGFDDVAQAYGVDDPRFNASAAFVDYDSDGWLDLYVTAYNGFAVASHKPCNGTGGRLDYCDPLTYPALPDRLFRNAGGTGFDDVSGTAGILQHYGNGLGVLGADLNLDGAPDIYVANDKTPNNYWINKRDGTFRDDALMAGTAYNADGVAEASMGVLAGDIDGDGDDDLFMTHVVAQTNTLYLNDGTGNFRDATDQRNLGASSLPFTGFGTVWIDFDNDGDQDILIANGGVSRFTYAGDDHIEAYGQTNQLYRNDGSGRFDDVSAMAGAAFLAARISRGTAVGDIDNDGDLDALVTNADGPVELLINEVGAENHWLRVRLTGTRSNRDGIGARVVVRRPDGTTLWRHAHTDGSYLSASDIRVHFGLGDDPAVESVGVIWSSGYRERWRDIEADSQIELVEGDGETWGGAATLQP